MEEAQGTANLDQEKATNNKLTNLAVTSINKVTSAKKAA